MIQKSLVYIGLPYSSNNASIIEERIKHFCNVDSFLNENGILTVSPILKHLLFEKGSSLPTDWNFWKEYSYNLLSRSDVLLILKLDGWENSSGVTAEIEFGKERNIPIHYLEKNENPHNFIEKINFKNNNKISKIKT